MTDTIGWTDYARFCQALDLEPDLQLRPAERRATLPSWICHELIQTQAAREKLLAWARATPKPWFTSAPLPADVLLGLAAVGDTAINSLIACAVGELPPPVVAYVMRECMFVSIGLTVGGTCSARIDVGDKPWTIMVSTGCGHDEDSIRGVLAHEVSHAWLLPEPLPEHVCPSSFYQNTVYQLPLDQVPSDLRAMVTERRSLYDRYEVEARRLVRAWGFKDVGQ